MGELLPPVVNGRPIYGSKDSIRHIRWAWDLEKVPACLVGRIGMGHWKGSNQCQLSVYSVPGWAAASVNFLMLCVVIEKVAMVLILVLGEDSRPDQISGARLVQGCADSNCAAKPHKRPSRPRVATS